MLDSSKVLVTKGILWNGVQLIINQSFTFVIRLVLAKLLLPEQFGLIGMATVFTGFVQVVNELGIGAALIQRKSEDLNPIHFHTAFWSGVVWSVLLYIVVSFPISYYASEFYNEPVLLKLIPVMSLGILIAPANLINKAQLTRAMNFKKMAFIDNTSNVVAGILALILAFSGFGVWSLAFNSVASILVAVPLYVNATKWKPLLVWDSHAFKEIFGFGFYTTITNILNYFMNNLDYLLIGKLLSAQMLGIYTFAFLLTDTFRSRLMSVINNVMYPLYGQKQSDPESLKRYYLKVVGYNSILVYPIMVFMFSLGQPFILQFFGEKWLPSVPSLQLLSISVMVHLMVNSNTSLIRGVGKPGLEMKLQLFKSIIFLPTLFLGIYYYGITGAAWAVLINKVIAVIIAQYTFNNLLDIKITTIEFFNAVKAPWLASIVSYIVVLLLYKILYLPYIFVTLCLFTSYSLAIYAIMGKELNIFMLELKSLRLKKQ